MNAIFSKVRKRGILLAALLLMGCLQLLAQTRTIKGEVRIIYLIIFAV